MIPHFEKMLYDNGQLLALYAEAWSAGGHRPLFKHICERVAEWTIREMQSPLGGYYASLDADSEGEEGRFYVWTPAEVSALLEPGRIPRVFRTLPDSTGRRISKALAPAPSPTPRRSARIPGSNPAAIRRLLLSARTKLLAERRQTRPSGPR